MCMCVYSCQLACMQITSFVHGILGSSVVCLAVPYFSTLHHNQYDFRISIF